MSARRTSRLDALAESLESCIRCPRLVSYRQSIEGRSGPYWNRPVAGFGDPRARLLVVGLAPGAHGANRTGRPFTGDAAGVWLYRGLFEFGKANREESRDRDDGLILNDVWIGNVVRCVPPENKPLPVEVVNCRSHLHEEMAALPNVRRLLALGRIAHDAVLDWTRSRTKIRKRDFPFTHGGRHELPGGFLLFDSYHTSRYNTSTGVLTWPMFVDVLGAALGVETDPP